MAYRGSKQLVIIDSSRRQSGTSANFTIDIKTVHPRFNSVAVFNFSCPKSWYSVPEGYNTFELQEDIFSAIITVPVGNYSRRSFASTIQTLLNSESPKGATYTVGYDTNPETVDTGKLTFTVSDNLGLQPSIIMPDSLHLPSCFGFDRSSVNTFENDTLESTNIVNYQPISHLLLKSSLVKDGEEGVLQELIVNDDPYGGHITFQNTDLHMTSKTFTHEANHIYSFSLTTLEDEQIDLNGQDVTFSLIFYEQDDINEVQRKALAIQTIKSL